MTRANRKSPTMFMVLVVLMMALVALTRDLGAETTAPQPAAAEQPQH